jgi:hypothetical protein
MPDNLLLSIFKKEKSNYTLPNYGKRAKLKYEMLH